MLPLPILVQEVRTEEGRPLVPLVATQWYCRSHCGPGQAETILLQRTLSLKMVSSLMTFSLLLAGREKLLGRVRVGAGWVCMKDAPGEVCVDIVISKPHRWVTQLPAAAERETVPRLVRVTTTSTCR